MKRVKVGFQISKEAVDILEDAKWVLRKPKNKVIEDLIIEHLKPVVGKEEPKKAKK